MVSDKKSEFEPEWADEEKEVVDRKPTASTFGARKDPHWWDISTFNKVSLRRVWLTDLASVVVS